MKIVLVALWLPLMAQAQIQKAWEARYNNGGTKISASDVAIKVLVVNGFMYTVGVSGADDIQTVKYTANGVPVWSAYYNGPADAGDWAEDMIVDRAGNVYVTGRSVDPSSTYWECITIKYDSTGREAWVDRYSHTNSYHIGNSLTLDTNGNIYVAGVAQPYYLLIKYLPDGQRAWLLHHSNAPPFEIAGGYTRVVVHADGDIYATGNGSGASRTARYHPDGTEVWAVNYAQYGGLDMDLDASGNVYTVGNGVIKYSSEGHILWVRTDFPVFHVAVSLTGNVYGSVQVPPPTVHFGEIWLCKYDSAGNRLWTNVISSAALPQETSLVLDAQENLYVCGTTRPPVGVPGNDNYTTIKYNSMGALIWRADYNGLGDQIDYAQAITLDDAGDPYVMGQASELTRGKDATIVKYSRTNGTVLWITRFDGRMNGQHRGFALGQDSSANIYVAGNSLGTDAWSQYALAKYAPNGTHLWSARFGTIYLGDSQLAGLVVDHGGNPVLTGNSGTVKFDSGGAIQWSKDYRARAITIDANDNVLITGFSNSTATTAKLDRNGNELWQRTHAVEPPQAIAVDTHGNVIVAGARKNWCDRTGCYYTFHVLKYDPLGNLVWTAGYNAAGILYFRLLSVRALSTDDENNVYVAGITEYVRYIIVKISPAGAILYNSIPANDSDGVIAMVVDNSGHVYLAGRKVVKVDPTGNAVWQRDFYPSSGIAYGIALDQQQRICVTGTAAAWNSGLDVVTTMFTTDGNRVWTVRHDGPSHRNDEGRAILVDRNGSAYIAGYDTLPSGGADMLTLKYSYLQSVQPYADGAVLIRFFGTPGREYEFQASPQIPPTWEPIGTGVANVDGIVSYLDSAARAFSKRFYRLVLP